MTAASISSGKSSAVVQSDQPPPKHQPMTPIFGALLLVLQEAVGLLEVVLRGGGVLDHGAHQRLALVRRCRRALPP